MMLKSIVFAVLTVDCQTRLAEALLERTHSVLADDLTLTEDKRTQLREMLKTQCEKYGAGDKVTEVENVGKNFGNCVKEIIDVPTIQREIEEAKPNGALDEVFKKYCAKTPELKTCFYTLLDGLSPCLDPKAIENMGVVKNITNQLMDFICYKDGDRIALFIAENGPQCFQSKVNELRECGNKLKDSFTSIEAARALSIDQKCEKFDELTSCIVTKLETCDTPTPGNMAESLFRYVRKESPCNDSA